MKDFLNLLTAGVTFQRMDWLTFRAGRRRAVIFGGWEGLDFANSYSKHCWD